MFGLFYSASFYIGTAIEKYIVLEEAIVTFEKLVRERHPNHQRDAVLEATYT